MPPWLNLHHYASTDKQWIVLYSVVVVFRVKDVKIKISIMHSNNVQLV